MDSVSNWLLNGAVALLGVIGLFVASGAGGVVGYYGGLGFFGFSVLFIMLQIKRAYPHGGNLADLEEGHRQG